MLKNCTESWKELWDLNKMSCGWVRKHWKGYSVVVAASCLGTFYYFWKKYE